MKGLKSERSDRGTGGKSLAGYFARFGKPSASDMLASDTKHLLLGFLVLLSG